MNEPWKMLQRGVCLIYDHTFPTVVKSSKPSDNQVLPSWKKLTTRDLIGNICAKFGLYPCSSFFF